MNDKLQRVKTLIMTGRDSAVKDEPLEDAYLDVSNYGIMATLVGRGKWALMTDNAGFGIFILSVGSVASTDLVDWIALR